MRCGTRAPNIGTGTRVCRNDSAVSLPPANRAPSLLRNDIDVDTARQGDAGGTARWRLDELVGSMTTGSYMATYRKGPSSRTVYAWTQPSVSLSRSRVCGVPFATCHHCNSQSMSMSTTPSSRETDPSLRKMPELDSSLDIVAPQLRQRPCCPLITWFGAPQVGHVPSSRLFDSHQLAIGVATNGTTKRRRKKPLRKLKIQPSAPLAIRKISTAGPTRLFGSNCPPPPGGKLPIMCTAARGRSGCATGLHLACVMVTLQMGA